MTTFRGEYTCHYEVVDDRTVRWHSDPDGNIDSSGTATFEPVGDGVTAMDYRATLVLDIEVNRFLAKAIGKVVETMIEREMRAFLRRMITDVEAAAGGSP